MRTASPCACRRTTELSRVGGMLCGQAMMAAADTAMVLALINQFGEFRPCTTVQMNTSFLKPLSNQDALVQARVRARRQVAGLRRDRHSRRRRRQERLPRQHHLRPALGGPLELAKIGRATRGIRMSNPEPRHSHGEHTPRPGRGRSHRPDDAHRAAGRGRRADVPAGLHRHLPRLTGTCSASRRKPRRPRRPGSAVWQARWRMNTGHA